MRLIDKDKLIDAIEECDEILYEPTVCGIENIINQAHTVDPWHYPSKGEYPTDTDEYLVWVKCIDISYCRSTTCLAGHSSCTCDIDLFNTKTNEWNMYMDKDVIAWMPLPEPPKEEA